MNILYDGQVFSWQRIGGISRYFVELQTNLGNDFSVQLGTMFTDNVYVWDNPVLRKKVMGHLLSNGNFRGKTRIQSMANRMYSMYLLEKNAFDIFHPTYYVPYFLRYLKKKPYVVTVYDMIHEKFPQQFSGDITIEYKRESILHASKIIAISKQTKIDLVDIYGIPENKIEVVYLGHSMDISREETVHNLPPSYILFVGSRFGYKNFALFLKAFKQLTELNPEISLVCTGSDFTSDEYALIRTLRLEKKIVRLFVSDAQLTYLYRHALCFVFPSLYEGFGIPILESFACGCPIALSNTSCFPEIAQNAGTYFNPFDIDSIIEAIHKLISDKEYCATQVAMGYKVLKQYSWKKMTEETALVYKSI